MTFRPIDLDPLVIVLVGKPARGKTHTARRLSRYLTWLGYDARVFNVGAYRRERLGAGHDAAFFDPENTEGLAARRAMARLALDDMLAWMRRGGEVALYDATNSTRRRRRWIAEAVRREGRELLFVELQCEDDAMIDANVRETKLSSPDYEGRSPDEALADFRARIRHYERIYEPVLPSEGSFLRIHDAGRRVELHAVAGWLSGRIVTFLLNVHLHRRPLYLTRHGESSFNPHERIGGDPELTPRGEAFADRLAAWLTETHPPGEPVAVWTSTLRRTLQTAAALDRPARPWRLLDEIDAGVCDGLRYADIADRLPDEHAARAHDKLRYRYPRGESYEDVIARLEPVILELERQQHPVLIVGHQAVLRALLAYFTDRPRADVPHLKMPLHTIQRLYPQAYGCAQTEIPLGPKVG